MRAFNYSEYTDKKWDKQTRDYMAKIYSKNEKFKLYLRAHKQSDMTVDENARLGSIKYSNALDGVFTNNTRAYMLSGNKTMPENSKERQFAGYRDALSIVDNAFLSVHLTETAILYLYSKLFSYADDVYIEYTKRTENCEKIFYNNGHTVWIFSPPSPSDTPDALTCICEQYSYATEKCGIDPLIAIPIFLLDFLCIAPFECGNIRMFCLLLNLLLRKNGFFIGSFISVEEMIFKTQNEFYRSLRLSQRGWNISCFDCEPFVKYILHAVLYAYDGFFLRIDTQKELAPAAAVRSAVSGMNVFTKSDVRCACPYLSLNALESALKYLLSRGEIRREGIGDNARYFTS